MDDKDALIAELRARVAELEQSEERFRTICENAPVMIDSFDKEGRCLLWNRECVDRLGYTKEDLDASGDPLALTYPDPEMRAQVLESILRADGTFREYRVRAKDGSLRVQEWADFCLPNGAVISVGRDVTEQRTIEQQLRHAQKLDAIGQLSGGIAHDFNNLLTVVLSNSELLLRKGLGLSQEGAELVEMTKEAAQRGADLVRKLLAFSRGEMLELRAVDARARLEGLVPTLRRLLPETIKIVLDAPEDLPLLRADPGALEQMLLNLVTNARDALPEGGEIVLRAQPAGDEVMLSVSDDGVGMSAATRYRALDPFFTTKSPRRGTGLGLAIVAGFMVQHGGRIEVRSEEGQGTTVELLFPVAEQAMEPTPATGEPGVIEARDAEKVLVVEDEPAIRRVACSVLRELGYQVTSAADGREALALLEDVSSVDLVVSDVVMPNMTGPQLRAALPAETRPPFLFMTGYASGVGETRGLGDEAHVLHKPWTVEQLALAVRKLLAVR
ncbi:MAG TPA: hypothetical protein DEA08_22405 [Planctomycetes bacterium]|nr:hypothetical protein [Planctomycetota bacterium]